jgi:hypothetical protein
MDCFFIGLFMVFDLGPDFTLSLEFGSYRRENLQTNLK